MAGDSRARNLVERFREVQDERTPWEPYWDDCARYVLPRYKGTFSQRGPNVSQAQRNNLDIYDSTAVKALPMFAATMESLLTPRQSRWHTLVATDIDLMKNLRIQRWFEAASDILFKYRYAPKANFSTAKHEEYMGLGAFGTGGMLIEAGENGGLSYSCQDLAGVFLLENHQGRVDTVFRRLRLSLRQAVQRWGEDALPKQMRDDFSKDRNLTKKYEFVHFIGPRTDFDPRRADARGMPFTSIYVSVEGPTVISEGGFRTFPIPISRYVTAPGEAYGRSVAMQALPAIMTLNEEKKTTLKSGQRAVDPPFLAYDDGVLDTVSVRSGAVNVGGLNSDGRELVKPLVTGANFAVSDMLMGLERKDINDIFLVSLYDILTEKPEMTATQTLERVREKGSLLSPTMGRQQSEALGPMIERELDILGQQGVLPPMPPELVEAEGEFDIVYDSPLSRAQKAEEAAGIYRYMEFAYNHFGVTGDPSYLDHLDPDLTAPHLLEQFAVPASLRALPEKIVQVRQQRSQEQQVDKAVQAAPAAAGLLKATGGQVAA
jgi:head-to-tail connecting protein